MARIFVTRQIPEVGINMLREAGHVVVVSEKDGVLTSEELTTALNGQAYDGVVSLLTDKINGEILEAAPDVKIISNYAVGYNNLATDELLQKGVTITNTPGVLTDTVAEYTVALMMAVAKRIPEADRFTRDNKYEGWAPELLLGSDLKGKTLGVVGAGRIGAGVATRALAFGMQVCYYDMAPSQALSEYPECKFHSTLEELLQASDVVTLHVPLLPTTTHLISTEQFSLMKSSAYLINTSRGAVIDEAALVTALREGTIRGAGLDVFEYEPELSDGLADLENVTLTPHIASASEETRNAMSRMVAENMVEFFDGNVPPNKIGEST